MKLNLTTKTGKTSKTSIEVLEAVYAAELNETMVHQVVVAYMASGRVGSVAQKNRSAVRGGGAKPWRQKGTGRARAGTSRSPIWRGGGVTFAANGRDYSQKINRKMYRGAVCCILSELLRQDRLMVVEKIELEVPKTKMLAEKMKSFGLTDVLIVAKDPSENLCLAARNLYKVDVVEVGSIDPVSLVGHNKVLMTVDAVRYLEGSLS